MKKSRNFAPKKPIIDKKTDSTMNTTYKILTVLALAAVAAATCIHPLFPNDLVLQHLGTAILMFPLVCDIKRNTFSKTSFMGLALFTLLHIIGARYIYSYVPYDETIHKLCGFSINEWIGATRNHYDRFVHFSYGLLVLPLCFQMVRQKIRCSQGTAIIMAWCMIQTGSLVYEVFEWALAIVMAPENAESYNGQQGDIWDAQKDMALALLGSTLTGIILKVKGTNNGTVPCKANRP